MNKSFKYLYAAACAAMIMNACNPAKEEAKQDEIAQPVAEKKPDTLTGNRIDNYYWMKLSDAQKNAEQKDEVTTKVINYLTSEND
jgi:oligopeptidase B